MPKKQDDIAVRAHVLRHRIINLEQKHSVAYPDDRAKLAEQIAEALTEYRELLPEIEAAAEKRKAELRELREETERKRQSLLMLLGQFPEPPRRNAVGDLLDGAPRFEKVYEYEVAPLRHYEEPVWERQQRYPGQQRFRSPAFEEELRRLDNPDTWLKEAS